MKDQREKEGGFPQQKREGQSTHSTTGDGHPPRPGEPGYEGDDQGGGASRGSMKQ